MSPLVYADQVLVKVGSEMLKPQWGVQPAGKCDQDPLLERHRLATLPAVAEGRFNASVGDPAPRRPGP